MAADEKGKALLKKIQELDFALLDVGLYLDSHPTCQHAMAYYSKYLAMRKEAAKEYESTVGPLTPMSLGDANRWTWVDGPWPWEREAN